MMIYERIEKELQSYIDAKYKTFNDRLSKSGYPSQGVRIPDLRALAKQLSKDFSVAEIQEFAPKTFEDVILKGLMIGHIADFDAFVKAWDSYLPAFDSWAQTDTTISSLKIMKKHKEEVLSHYLYLKTSKKEFDKRFLVILTLDYFIDESHLDFVLNLWADLSPGQYYCDMAVAWALSVAFVRFYDKTLAFLKENRFSVFVHNKAIQKSRESFRITAVQKTELLLLKR